MSKEKQYFATKSEKTESLTKTTPNPNLLSKTQIEINERKAWSLGTFGALSILAVGVLLFTFSLWGFVASAIALDSGRGSAASVACIVSTSLLMACIILSWSGLVIVSPGQTRVVQFFGRYIGTLRRPGLSYIVPLSHRKNISVRVRNFETGQAKVNDANGNPINVAAIVVWQVKDTARAIFTVDEYAKFIESQAESALRHIATQYPYDHADSASISLRGSTEEVNRELAAAVTERVHLAGLEIIEARISSLSYAPEIAQAMLQRQQASAIVDARETIVDGAVSMVEQALAELEKKEIVALDPERRATMVSNLLVVLCSDNNAQPVINTGSLYQ